MSSKAPSPILLAISLLIAVTTCSSAGVAFSILSSMGVPAALAASWRLWCCEMIQLIPFLVSLQKMKKEDVDIKTIHHNTKTNLFLPRYISSLPIMAFSGICLGIHFSAWVYSLEKTSMLHSLLFVSMGPIIIHGGQWLLIWIRPLVLICLNLPEISRPSKLETLGVFVGILGTCFVLLDIPSSSPSTSTVSIPKPTFEGDFAAFIGAFAVSLYLIVGRQLRTWVPLWLYTFPVIGFAIITSVVLSFWDPQNPAIWSGYAENSVFGFWNTKFFWYSMYLGVGPGVCGHTLINGLLKYITPLTVSTALLTEPILGSLLGYFFDLQELPHFLSCLGGLILILGLILIVAGESGYDISWKDIISCTRMNILNIDDHTSVADASDEKDGMMKNYVEEKESYGTLHFRTGDKLLGDPNSP